MHLLFVIATCSVFGLLCRWKAEQHFHQRRLRRLTYRIHVNGIRGKSTVTRIVSGLLRAAEIQTVAKTTGSAACLIDAAGVDQTITRNGSPTILEQVEIIRRLDSNTEALVIECMAIKPEYQSICEDKIVQSNIGIITNVREDHQDQLGQTLEEIASNLLRTCPYHGVLITSEQNPRLLPQFRRVAEQRKTELIVANPKGVSDEEIGLFSYVAFKENVAIGFALAEWLGIPRDVALKGMVDAAPDPGVLRFVRKTYRGRAITFADLFAVNDRESVIACAEKVAALVSGSTTRIGLLNNRADREQRAIQFARIAATDLNLDFIGLLGAYERQVEAELMANGFPQSQAIRLGSTRGLEGQDLIDHCLEHTASKELLILGLVNIHTPQAESLRQWFGTETGGAN